MKHKLARINNVKRKNCIDEMEAILNQISEFQKLIDSTDDNDISSQNFKQEYRLLKQHVEWVMEDITDSNYVTNKNYNSKAS